MFANLKAKLLKVDLRKGGKKIFVFESDVRMSAGELEAINEMIDQEVVLGLDAQVIAYRVPVNAKTNEPIIKYKVDETGIVSVSEVEGSQVEMDLGLPKEKQLVKDEPAEIARSIVEEFILEGLAPQYADLNYDFIQIIESRKKGDGYLRIASDLNLSSGSLAEILDEYCRRIAPLAAKWQEWREGQQQAVEAVIEQVTKQEEPPSVEEAAEEQEEGAETEEAGEDDGAGPEPSQEAIKEHILTHKPRFDDIDFDPAVFIEKHESGGSWMDVAAKRGMNSSQLQTAWGKYKKRVIKAMRQNGAA